MTGDVAVGDSFGIPEPKLTSSQSWLNVKLKTIPSALAQKVPFPERAVAEICQYSKIGRSIESMAIHLVHQDLVKSDKSEEAVRAARAVVFMLLGWQTMLYEASFGTCPPTQLAINDVLDGYTSQAYMSLRQDFSRIKSALPGFLLGFGLMLPQENICLSSDQDDLKAFEEVSIVTPKELNADLLKTLAKVKIKWVDVMAPHLEFDKDTHTLFLFRHPSFALANIPSDNGSDARSVLYSCAALAEENTQWASETEITQLLTEILLSYRLLFGQSRASRKYFKTLDVFRGEQGETHDLLLPQLCMSTSTPLSFPDKEFYRLHRDFPILRSRFATLQYQMSNLKPRGWKEIWRDKRDSAQWLTFWAVILIGGSGIFLSLVQVILQAAQLAGVK